MKNNIAYIIKQMHEISHHRPVKKALQKTVFLIEQKGVSLGYDYVLHFYGPYCAELDQETAQLRTNGIIKFEYGQFGHKIDIADNSMEIISNDLSVDQLEIIDGVIKRYKNNTASELELLTTAIYAYTRIHASTQKAVYDSIKRIKGEKYSDDEIEWAINEFPYFDIAIKQ